MFTRLPAQGWILTLFIIQTFPAGAVVGPPQPVSVLPNQQFGDAALRSTSSTAAKQASAETLAAWERLKAAKGNDQGLVDFSPATGLPHTVAYLKAEVEGKSLEDKARNFLLENSALFLKGKDAGDLSLEGVRRDSFGSSHVDFSQKYDGLRVYGAGLSVHFDPEERVSMVNGDYLPDLHPANGSPNEVLFAEEALRKALRPFGRLGSAYKAIEEPELCLYSRSPAKDSNLLAYRFSLLAGGVESHRLLFADAISGEILAFFPTGAYLDGTAMVYDPNSAQSGLVQRTLTDLDDSGKLRGPLLNVIDEENDRVVSGPRTFNFSPDTPGFRQASVYYYLTETRKRMRALGFNDIAAGDIPTVVDARDSQTGGEFNNAFYNHNPRGFVFGNGDGSVFANLAQDFDVASHEFGHFFDFSLTVSQPTPLHSPRRAWGEACGDTVAAIINGDPNVGESSVPGKPFLRTIDNAKRFPNDLVNEEHLDGEIYGGANWDFMKLRGGGAVNQAARDEMARVMIAGIPFIPMTNVQFKDILIAFVQGDMNRGGANVANLRTAYGMHGITETSTFKQAEDRQTERLNLAEVGEKGVAGFQELQNGVPVVGSLANGAFADFFIRIPAGSTSLTVQTFAPFQPPQGDVILRVAPRNYTGPEQIYTSDLSFIDEQIVVTNASPVPLSQDDVWLIEAADFAPDFQFSTVGLVATVAGAGGQVQQIQFNQLVNGTISTTTERDAYFFSGSAGQAVDIAVNRTGAMTLDPLVLLGNSVGQLIAFDDNSGGSQNALISGFTLPANDNYLIVVQAAVTALGPVTQGDYSLLLTPGTAAPPTPTPIPSDGATVLTSGVPVNGTIPAGNPQAGQGASSPHFKITIPAGAKELFVRVHETPTPGGKLVVQVRKGQPIGQTLDDFVGLGGRRSHVLVTPDSRVPLSPSDFFIQFFNLDGIPHDFQLLAVIEVGGGGNSEFDLEDDGVINAKDLLLLLGNPPMDPQTYFTFARVWGATGVKVESP
ncbi:MAG: pre-peptidase C-terminal domain-containing protein [Candidatus Omnitrophica bacterium]|nr:pre-peptidase C-terminal domain-containing protein [Candidatus Omnitrophota bacterium]